VVRGLINEYPANLAVYEIHVSDAYESTTQWDENRWSFYYIAPGYIPRFVVDGLNDAPDDCNTGPNNPCDSTLYEGRLNVQQAVPTDVTVSLTGYAVGAQTYDIVAHVCIEAGGAAKTMRLYMVDLLDYWPSASMPPYYDYYRNTLRQGAVPVDVALTPGACTNVWNTFTFDATSWNNQANIKIMAWLQEPLSVFPAHVHQATTMPWPFPVGDADGDGFLDNVDNCPRDYNPTQVDSDFDGHGDECDLCPGYDDHLDADGDGVPDGCDVCWGDDATGDSDGDGVCDDLDECWGDDATGDSDGDGVCDDLDACWGDDATGDSDGDGICDDLDECEGDDATGDSDGDGVCDDLDQCWGDDASGDSDGDNWCNDLDCDDANPNIWDFDDCGVCGGDNSTCGLFDDDFETGDTSGWDATVGS